VPPNVPVLLPSPRERFTRRSEDRKGKKKFTRRGEEKKVIQPSLLLFV
jgi:hypothetical protein